MDTEVVPQRAPGTVCKDWVGKTKAWRKEGAEDPSLLSLSLSLARSLALRTGKRKTAKYRNTSKINII